MKAPARPTIPGRPSMPARPTVAAPQPAQEVVEDAVVEEVSAPSIPARPSAPRPTAAPVAEETVVEETTAVDTAPASDNVVVTEVEPSAPVETAPTAPAAKGRKPAKAAPTETEPKAPAERRLTADALLEGEYGSAVVAHVMAQEGGALKAILENFESDEIRIDFFNQLNREMNGLLLGTLIDHSVPMFNNDASQATPVYKRVAPGKDVVRNPSSTEFPANLVEGRVTVLLQRGGIPLRAQEGTSTRLTADQAAAEKDALVAAKAK